MELIVPWEDILVEDVFCFGVEVSIRADFGLNMNRMKSSQLSIDRITGKAISPFAEAF